MILRTGVVTFPGFFDDHDTLHIMKLCRAEAVLLWHGSDSIDGMNATILLGGLSYGGYLCCGAITRLNPVMDTVIDVTRKGPPVLGICNGFRLLCETYLLDGTMIRNVDRHFICRDRRLCARSAGITWTYDLIKDQKTIIILKSDEGDYQTAPETLKCLEDNIQVIFRYLDNPNGSVNDIADITNEHSDVVGLMLHPEHNVEVLTGTLLDDRGFLESLIQLLTAHI